MNTRWEFNIFLKFRKIYGRFSFFVVFISVLFGFIYDVNSYRDLPVLIIYINLTLFFSFVLYMLIATPIYILCEKPSFSRNHVIDNEDKYDYYLGELHKDELTEYGVNFKYEFNPNSIYYHHFIDNHDVIPEIK